MQVTKFYGEPNLEICVQMRKFLIRFDDKGELLMSEDHPALERMKNTYRFEQGEESSGLEDGKKVRKCKQCDFETDNMGILLAHIRKEHPKED